MKARIQESGLAPASEITDVRSIVIYDDYEQPIILVQKLEDDTIFQIKAGDVKFRECLAALGIGLNAVCKVHKK